jgi:hypothetical protein
MESRQGFIRGRYKKSVVGRLWLGHWKVIFREEPWARPSKGKGKGKDHTGTSHEGPKGKRWYSSTLSLTSALDGVGWSMLRSGCFTLGKETQCPLYRRLGGAPGPFWTGSEKLASTGIRSPDRPSRSGTELSWPRPGKIL